MTGERLERRFRRLLRCHPAGHLSVYGEEMIGVLMSGAAPGQRWPGAREAADLVVSGLRARLRIPIRAAGSPAWSAATAVLGYGGAVLLSALPAYRVVAGLFAGGLFAVSRTATALALGWALVAVAAGFGRWRTAAIGATAGVVGQAVAIARVYVDAPSAAITSWWLLVFAITAAAALITRIPARGRPDQGRGIGTRPVLAVVVAAAVPLAIIPFLTATTTIWGNYHASAGDPGVPVAARVPLVAFALVTLRLRPSVRRRVAVLAAPAVATMAVVTQTYSGFLTSSPRFSPPVYLVAPQWIGLAVTPLLAFTFGCWLLIRHERRLASGVLLN